MAAYYGYGPRASQSLIYGITVEDIPSPPTLDSLYAAIAALTLRVEDLEADMSEITSTIIDELAIIKSQTEDCGGGSSTDNTTLLKLVRAILHDNKMVLDAVENLKGKNGHGSSAQKDPSAIRNAVGRGPRAQ